MGSQVPLMLASLKIEAKPTFEPQEIIKIWLISIKVRSSSYYAKIFVGTFYVESWV